MARKIKVVFLGSGAIAVPVLRALAASPEIELAAVISQPDRPAGRKRVLMPTALGAAALADGMPLRRIPDVNAPEAVGLLRELAPDLLCVVSFGQILKPAVLAVPRVACVNIHASLLPRYRGASPITQAILCGDRTAGVCFMRMEKGLDTGPVYRRLTMPLTGAEYADALELKMGELAAGAAPETLREIAAGARAVPQDDAAATVCRKIAKHDGIVDWRMPAARIEAMIRAYYPWPGASAAWRSPSGRSGSLTLCAGIPAEGRAEPGECADLPGRLVVGCGDGTMLEITELTPAGGRRMTAAAFRNGLRGELPRFVLEHD